jgi:hypothetical protein
VQTGGCDATARFCLVAGWCPPEAPRRTAPNGTNTTSLLLLSGAPAVQATVRISVQWMQFLASTGRAATWENFDGPSGGRTPGVNVFSVADLLARAGVSYDDVAVSGAEVTLNFHFDCDWDLARAREACSPEVLATRIDRGRGYSTLRAVPWVRDDGGAGYAERTLVRMSGIHFQLQFSGQARQFDFGAPPHTPLLCSDVLGTLLTTYAPFSAHHARDRQHNHADWRASLFHLSSSGCT